MPRKHWWGERLSVAELVVIVAILVIAAFAVTMRFTLNARPAAPVEYRESVGY